MDIAYFQANSFIHFFFDSSFPLGWCHLCIRSFCPYSAVSVDIRSGKHNCLSCNPSAAQCREIINKSVIKPNVNICICHWYMESKTADENTFLSHCRHRWCPERGKSRSHPSPRVITVIFEVLWNVQGFVFDSHWSHWDCLLMSQAGLRELNHGIRRLKIVCARLTNKKQLLFGYLIHCLAEDLTDVLLILALIKWTHQVDNHE